MAAAVDSRGRSGGGGGVPLASHFTQRTSVRGAEPAAIGEKRLRETIKLVFSVAEEKTAGVIKVEVLSEINKDEVAKSHLLVQIMFFLRHQLFFFFFLAACESLVNIRTVTHY